MLKLSQIGQWQPIYTNYYVTYYEYVNHLHGSKQNM